MFGSSGGKPRFVQCGHGKNPTACGSCKRGARSTRRGNKRDPGPLEIVDQNNQIRLAGRRIVKRIRGREVEDWDY